jgi:hypothetical protein
MSLHIVTQFPQVGTIFTEIQIELRPCRFNQREEEDILQIILTEYNILI